MKYLYSLILFSLFSLNAYAKTYQIIVPDNKVKVIENDVLDLEVWINGAIDGKYNNCKSRLIKSEIDLSVKNGEAIPAGEDAILNKHFNRPDYKNRKQRDAEEEAQRKKIEK